VCIIYIFYLTYILYTYVYNLVYIYSVYIFYLIYTCYIYIYYLIDIYFKIDFRCAPSNPPGVRGVVLPPLGRGGRSCIAGAMHLYRIRWVADPNRASDRWGGLCHRRPGGRSLVPSLGRRFSAS